MRNVAGKLTLESSALCDMPMVIRDPQKLNTLANSSVNFKAHNYGYTTALNNAVTAATDLLTIIDGKYEIDKQD